MSPIQQMLLGVGAVATKTYVDDIFSTFLYKGTGSARSINNGIDLSGEGGMTWLKERDGTYSHRMNDTERGANKQLYTNLTNAEATETTELTSFNNNGFSLGTSTSINDSNNTYSSWTFRKSPMFDIVTYTGNGTAGRTVAHNLGSVPGFIVIKCTSDADHWCCYHKSRGGTKFIALDLSNAESTNGNGFHDTTPTSTEVTLGISGRCNGDGKTYVMYLFAGGESTAATARSVDFDGSGDYLTVAGPGSLGTSTDFTMECWVYLDATSGHKRIFSSNEGVNSDEATLIRIYDDKWQVYSGRIASNDHWYWQSAAGAVSKGQWYHVALVRHGSNNAFYVNGELQASSTGSHSTTITTLVVAGGYGSENIDGKVSNARFVNGTAVYTSAFRPPTEPLTSITNTTLLCCNNSSTTGKTTGGTITANGDPTASTDSPFDDPAGYVFGESGSESVIKCGSYVGSGSAGLEVNLGFEPQWVMFKRSSGSDSWYMADSMRGIMDDAADPFLAANETTNEAGGTAEGLALTSTGFKLMASGNWVNASGENYIYMAIRRPDGYVGKPPSLGTGVFAMDYGSSSSTIPTFDSGFPVDFSIVKKPAATDNWYTGARLVPTKSLKTDTTDTEATYSNWLFDSNVGWATGSNNTYLSYNWKRHTGFDVVTYTGNGVSTGDTNKIPHGLNQIPEMAWIKNRGATADWGVYHKDMHSSIPQKYYMKLNTTAARAYEDQTFNSPTATHFNLRHNALVNSNNSTFIMLLFSSVSGISKVGSYTGNGASGVTQTITVGFQPRLLIIKCISEAMDWQLFDSVRGLGSGSDPALELNTNDAQDTTSELDVTSTGFVLGYHNKTNKNTADYIYYAHA